MSRAIKVSVYAYTYTGATDDTEWTVDCFVSLADRSEHMSSDKVEFGDVITGVILETRVVAEMDFDAWVREYDIPRKEIERMEEHALEQAREAIADRYDAAGDYARDSAIDRELGGR